MSAGLAIARRDLLASFTAPAAWLVLAGWTLVVNTVFAFSLYRFAGTAGSDAPLYVTALWSGAFLLVLLAPAVTMASFAGERAQGTMQLLLTVPVREIDLVIGKFLAAWLTLVAMIAATLPQPVILAFISELGGPQLAAGYLGLVLAAAACAGIGVWMSLLVDTPIAAYVLTFGILAVLTLVGLGEGDQFLGPVARAIGWTPRLTPFLRGIVEAGNCCYFLGLAVAGCALAHGVLRAKRIHG